MSGALQPGADRLIYEFLRRSGLSAEPVIAFTSQGTVMQNSAARRFSPEDVRAIQGASQSSDSRGHAIVATSLGPVQLSVEQRLGRENRVVRIVFPDPGREPCSDLAVAGPIPLAGHSAHWRRTLDAVRRAQGGRRPLLVSGEAGVGKASLAAGEALRASRAGQGISIVDAQAIVALGPGRWFDRADEVVRSGDRVVVTRVDALEPRQLGGLRALVRTAPAPHRIALTIAADSPAAAGEIGFMLDAECVAIPALRSRGEDLAELWRSFALRAGAPRGTALTDAALAALREYAWPGNLPELRAAAIHSVSRASHPVVRRRDLPSYLPGRPQRGLMERAEQDAIRRALLVADGNRSRAAEILGISRATLYRKIRVPGHGGT